MPCAPTEVPSQRRLRGVIADSTPRVRLVYPVASMPPLKQTPPDGYVPMSVAVERIGKSARTLVRWIEAGDLEGEQIARPQGTIWYVKLPPEYTAEAADDAARDGVAESDQESAPPGNDLAVAALDAALRRAEERIAALDERNERQAAYVVEQAQRIGRLEAERNAAEARAAQLAEDLAAAQRPWWRRLLG
jgi:hypothetical protein